MLIIDELVNRFVCFLILIRVQAQSARVNMTQPCHSTLINGARESLIAVWPCCCYGIVGQYLI